MDALETVISRDTWDADRRFKEMELSRPGLLAVRGVAMGERASATPFHCSNSPGTLAYHQATWALRNEFVGGNWALCRQDGIEGIRNDALKIKIAFSNVDLACDDNHIPKPRSEKGAGAERASGTLFGDLPHYAERPTGDVALYYLMVDQYGAAELTRPIVKNRTFVSAVERIYVTDGEDDGTALLEIDNPASASFDPQVVRK